MICRVVSHLFSCVLDPEIILIVYPSLCLKSRSPFYLQVSVVSAETSTATSTVSLPLTHLYFSHVDSGSAPSYVYFQQNHSSPGVRITPLDSCLHSEPPKALKFLSSNFHISRNPLFSTYHDENRLYPLRRNRRTVTFFSCFVSFNSHGSLFLVVVQSSEWMSGFFLRRIFSFTSLDHLVCLRSGEEGTIADNDDRSFQVL